ncbi:MAG: pur operon repressor [Christensenellales bacterium]
MNKITRSERIAMILLMLAQKPNKLHTLTEFAEKFGCAKSTLSEDMSALKKVLSQHGLGRIETVPGAAGGVKYLMGSTPEQNIAYIQSICDILASPSRILPGGFLYTVDLFSDPTYIRKLGEIIAAQYYGAEPDVVVTVESKGVPIGLMVAQALGKNLVVARRDSKVTEGSVVTLNYLSTSSKRLQTMSLARRAVREGQKALIVDDFVKGGGTVGAICNMMKEFAVTVVGVCSLVASAQAPQRRIRDFRTLMVLDGIDEEAEKVSIRPADWLVNSK